MNLKQLIDAKKGEKLFLLGNEAAVRGALESGVAITSTYPGTPSSEIGDILSKIAKDTGIYFEFSVNEKIAMEVAASASASGLRSFVFMKHVGLNVAADSFISTAYTGIRGGMVILTADDPSMFSSQNEQDNRNYARLAKLPLFEPSNPQELLEMMKYGYELSEMFSLPVIIRTTTRVSHMRGVVQVGSVPTVDNNGNYPKTWKKGFFEKDPKQYVPVPASSKVMHKELVEKMAKIEEFANKTKYNQIYSPNELLNDDDLNKYNDLNESKIGVISSGSAFNYIADTISNHKLNIDLLKLGLSYPFPRETILEFIKNKEKIFVVEEVDPIMEKEILAIIGSNKLNISVHGKLDGTFPLIYEFNQDITNKSLNKVLNFTKEDFDEDLEISKEKKKVIDDIPIRPPILCAGCPHRALYYSVRMTADEMNIPYEELIFPSDIGCYTLGIESPYEMADYLLSMGSSVGTSGGFSKATDQKIICYLGDSTFFHSGITPLINAVHNGHKFILTVLDNRTTAMTGGQSNPGLPVDGMGNLAPELSIEKIAKACGVEFIETINPLLVKKTKEVYKKALEFDGVSVIISKYPCMLLKEGHVQNVFMKIHENTCTKCLDCVLDLACPAINQKETGEVIIDKNQCRGCKVCVQICPELAIKGEKI